MCMQVVSILPYAFGDPKNSPSTDHAEAKSIPITPDDNDDSLITSR